MSLVYQALLRVYEQNNIVNSVFVDDWTAEWAVISSNDFLKSQVNIINFWKRVQVNITLFRYMDTRKKELQFKQFLLV